MQSTHEKQQPVDRNAWDILAQYLRRPSWLLTLLGLTTLVLYSGALSFEFVWDDWPQIVNSPMIRSWSNLPRAFGSDLWYHVARHQVYYRPLFVVWSILNYSLFGLRPWGWHLTAILAHMGATLAVFWMVRKLGLEYWTSALAALIFALHPIHIEPVVWISAASDTMVTMFAALALAAHLSGRDTTTSHWLSWRFAALAFLACALLTKEAALTLFVLVGIYEWLHPQPGKGSLARRTIAAAIETMPYALLTVAYLFLRKHALTHSTGQFDPGHTTADVFRTLPMVLTFYLKKLLMPIGLTGLYYTPYVSNAFLTQFVIPACVLAGVMLALWYWNRKEENSTVAFAGIWLLVGLAPALYLRNFANGDFVRDRYICLSSIGFAILLAMVLRRIPPIGRYKMHAVQAVAVLALCAAYAGASLSQQVHWASDLLVLIRGDSLYPDNPYSLVGLAAEYSERGAHEKAIALAQRAVQLHPDYGAAPLAMAESYIRAGRFDEGRVWLKRVSPEFIRSEMGLASFAGLYGRMGDFDTAFAFCNEILMKEPNLYSALYNCGNVHLMAGQYLEAERLLRRAVDVAPEQAAPRHYLGRALLSQNRTNEALAYLQQAVLLDGKVWDYHYWLAVGDEKTGNLADARVEYEQCLRVNPESSEAKIRLAALGAR